MTITDLLTALRASDAVLYVDQAGALRYAGPRLPADAPIRAAIATHRDILRELFTYAPAGRCADPACYRLPAHEGAHLALGAGQSGTADDGEPLAFNPTTAKLEGQPHASEVAA